MFCARIAVNRRDNFHLNINLNLNHYFLHTYICGNAVYFKYVILNSQTDGCIVFAKNEGLYFLPSNMQINIHIEIFHTK